MAVSYASQAFALIYQNPVLTGIAGLLCWYALHSYTHKIDLSHIPAVTSTGLLSYYEGYQFLHRGRDMVEEGYRRFRGYAFRIPLPDRWHVILASPELINELRLAKESDLSANRAVAQRLQTKYTSGENITLNVYHNTVVQSPLTRNLSTRFGEIHDEIIQSFNELVPANEKDWLAVPAVAITEQIICRTSNRLFLGLPICRKPEWIKLNIEYTHDILGAAAVVNLLPEWLKPFAGRYLSPANRALRLGRTFLEKVITERISDDDEYGKNHDGRPNDLISWLLEYAEGEERTVDNIIYRILIINILAIHTTSINFAQALINLAAYPEYVAPMREEVNRIVKQEGWTRASLAKMRSVDSFLKESARMEGLSAVFMNRIVANPAGFTFSNGLHLPYGTFVGCATFGIHHDPDNYEDPHVFDGFRFSKIQGDDTEYTKHQLVSTSLDYLHFGHGKHACPGRFFAVNELKLMLAHVLVTYDVTLQGDSKPLNNWRGVHISPDAKAKILFKRLPA